MTTTAAPGRRIQLPFKVVIEPRLEAPAWLSAAVSFGAIIVALLLGAIILKLVGGNPIAVYAHIGRAAFGNLGVFSDTLVKATPIILTGLAAVVAFRMRLWNIGAEGQFYMGALGASAVVLSGVVGDDSPAWLMLSLMLIAGVVSGALWALIPGLLKARLQVNEIITTLMMNYIALALVNYFIFGLWSEGGFQMSRTFPRSAWLPRLADYAKEVPLFRGLTTHLGLVFAIVAAGLVWYLLYRSLWGYEIRLLGDNPRAARYAGININRNTALVMMVSGALAGLAGMSEISGVVHRLQAAISPGYGFSGIIVAWLAKLNPLAVVPVSILFGALILAGREIQPNGVPRLIQGIILFALIASEVLLRYKVRLVRATAEG